MPKESYPGTSTSGSLATEWRDLFDRLPQGVEYTHVKMIILSLPLPLEVMPWLGTRSGDGVWDLFRGKTFRAVDRALQRAERQITVAGADPDDRAKQHVAMLRYLFVQHVLRAIAESPTEQRQIVIRLVNPPLGMEHVPGLEQRGWVLEVWDRSQPTRRLHRVVVPPGAPPWGDPPVNYYDPILTGRLTAEAVRGYFPEVMRRRIGHGWRSEREPTGWPMLTQRAVPALYDYLHPFYTARTYRHARGFPTRGDYPTKLMKDIADILRLELPQLAMDVTAERVQAAVQRYRRRAHPDRLMGADMFRVWPRTGTP